MRGESPTDAIRCSLNTALDVPELYVYGEIGDPYDGLTASDIVPRLADLRSSQITVRINSGGGSVFDGIALHSALVAHPARVTTVVDGIAASAASFVAQAGDVRIMRPAASMMIHNASGLAYGTSVTMRDMADLLDQVSATIAGIYADRSGRPARQFADAMAAETWYQAQAAVDAGLADQVSDGATNLATAFSRDQQIRARARATLRRG